MSTTESMAQLSGEELERLLSLLKGADSVELKLTVPDGCAPSGGEGPADRPARCADPPSRLLRHPRPGPQPGGRRGARPPGAGGVGDDSVVKLRPVEPDDLPAKLRRSPGFGVEVDAMPGGYVCSGSMKAKIGVGRGRQGDTRRPTAHPQAVHQGAAKMSATMPRGHRARRPRHGARPDLRAQVEVGAPAGFDRRLVAEMWLYPDGLRIVELSTKCLPSEAFEVAAQTRVGFLADRGIDQGGEQQTKTRTTLEFFARELNV